MTGSGKVEKKSSAEQQQREKLAPGPTGVEGLNREATADEVAEENMTEVTKPEYDRSET